MGALSVEVGLAAAAGEIRGTHAFILGRLAEYANHSARAAVLAHVGLCARVAKLAQKARIAGRAPALGRCQRRRHTQAVV